MTQVTAKFLTSFQPANVPEHEDDVATLRACIINAVSSAEAGEWVWLAQSLETGAKMARKIATRDAAMPAGPHHPIPSGASPGNAARPVPCL